MLHCLDILGLCNVEDILLCDVCVVHRLTEYDDITLQVRQPTYDPVAPDIIQAER